MLRCITHRGHQVSVESVAAGCHDGASFWVVMVTVTVYSLCYVLLPVCFVLMSLSLVFLFPVFPLLCLAFCLSCLVCLCVKSTGTMSSCFLFYFDGPLSSVPYV